MKIAEEGDMEIIEESGMKFLELVAAEFNIEKGSFRAFFSYKNSAKPVFAIVITYYHSTMGTWKSFVSLQEPYKYMVNPAVYGKLHNKLQKFSDEFMRHYKKGIKIDEDVNHIISKSLAFDV